MEVGASLICVRKLASLCDGISSVRNLSDFASLCGGIISSVRNLSDFAQLIRSRVGFALLRHLRRFGAAENLRRVE